jgi:hypothetical protein
VSALLRLDDVLDGAAAATATGSSAASPSDGSRRAGTGADDVTNDPIVDGVAVADDHLRRYGTV